MAENNQKPRQDIAEIRMKPGAGRMLIGRMWRMPDGTLSATPPKRAEDRVTETEDMYLEAREVDESGNPGEGPTAQVPLEAIARFLVNGKPSRVIDGYPMIKSGGGVVQDEAGNQVVARQSYSPGLKPGTFDDATFEVVRIIKAA